MFQKITDLRDVVGIQGVYAIKNEVNGKVYIGSACATKKSHSMYDRLWNHLYRLRRGISHNTYLQRAFDKHGEGNFGFYLVESVSGGVEDVIAREQYWLDTINPTDESVGYNMSPTAQSNAGSHWSDESKKAITGENHPFYNQHHTEEAKARMGIQNKGNTYRLGKRHSDGTKAKISLNRKGKCLGEDNGFYGREHSDETKEKISKAKKGKCGGEKHPMFGQRHSEEAKQKMRETKRKNKLLREQKNPASEDAGS